MIVDRSAVVVSVIIPSFNTGRTILRAIDSALATNFPGLEVVVIDDGSSDNSVELVSQYAKKNNTVRIGWHPGHRNLGIAATRNEGVRVSRGRYIAFLDADDTYLPNRFDTAVELLEGDPAVNAVCEPYSLVHESGSRSDDMRTVDSPPLPETADGEALFLAALTRGGFPHTTSITVRKLALDRVGGFPNFKYCLEKPVWLKLYSVGGIRHGSVLPVARYHLHEQSTCAKHEKTAAFRFEEVAAYLDVYRWVSKQGMSRQFTDGLAARVLGKFVHYASYVGTLRRSYIADVLMAPITVARGCPRVLGTLSFWKASLRMLISVRPASTHRG